MDCFFRQQERFSRRTRAPTSAVAAVFWVLIGMAVQGSAQNYEMTFLQKNVRKPILHTAQSGKNEKHDTPEPIVVLVHPRNPVKDLTQGQLARIYRGEVTEWPDGTPITVINRPIDSEVRIRFYRQVLGSRQTQPFYQPDSPFPFETRRVDQESVVATFVARDRSAIAYCYRSGAHDHVKILTIGGRSPEEQDYVLN
jgi:PBP superfamily domain